MYHELADLFCIFYHYYKLFIIISLPGLYKHLKSHYSPQLKELIPFFMVKDHSLTPLHFFGIVFLCIFARLFIYSFKFLLKTHFLNSKNLLTYNLSFTHSIFIVLYMRLEAFALGTLQMSFNFDYYYYYCNTVLH